MSRPDLTDAERRCLLWAAGVVAESKAQPTGDASAVAKMNGRLEVLADGLLHLFGGDVLADVEPGDES
ncbi:hypothetical protein [Streptomyces sp. SDr-06]|uniref:hypothetical protein n=1 Tax=Streptomyces sp. SDr-06 TaxID=2267702 RepID=UPI0011C046C1|nr:hypothetical protein [Streptomyces sp. SDr-06]